MQPTPTTAWQLPVVLEARRPRRCASIDSFFAASMKPQVLTTMTSASARSVGVLGAAVGELRDVALAVDGVLVAAEGDDGDLHASTKCGRQHELEQRIACERGCRARSSNVRRVGHCGLRSCAALLCIIKYFHGHPPYATARAVRPVERLERPRRQHDPPAHRPERFSRQAVLARHRRATPCSATARRGSRFALWIALVALDRRRATLARGRRRPREAAALARRRRRCSPPASRGATPSDSAVLRLFATVGVPRHGRRRRARCRARGCSRDDCATRLAAALRRRPRRRSSASSARVARAVRAGEPGRSRTGARAVGRAPAHRGVAAVRLRLAAPTRRSDLREPRRASASSTSRRSSRTSSSSASSRGSSAAGRDAVAPERSLAARDEQLPFRSVCSTSPRPSARSTSCSPRSCSRSSAGSSAASGFSTRAPDSPRRRMRAKDSSRWCGSSRSSFRCCWRRAPRCNRTRALARRHTLLSLPVVALLGAIIVSAALRMKMYVHYYGLTTDRLYPLVFMAWLAIVLAVARSDRAARWGRPFVAGAVISGSRCSPRSTRRAGPVRRARRTSSARRSCRARQRACSRHSTSRTSLD